MKSIFKLFFICSICILNYSFAIDVQKDAVVTYQYVDMISFKNKIATLGYYSTPTSPNPRNIIELHENGKVNSLPLLTKNSSGNIDSLDLSQTGIYDFRFDINGDIYISLKNGIYKYKESFWEKLEIAIDSFIPVNTVAEFSTFCFDDKNKIYFALNNYRNIDTLSGGTILRDFLTSNIFTFEGSKATLIDKSKNGFYGYSKGMVYTSTGKLITQRSSYNFPNNELTFIDKTGNVIYKDLKSPHQLLNKGYGNSSKYINKIFEDSKGRIWFCLTTSGSSRESGLLILDKEENLTNASNFKGYRVIKNNFQSNEEPWDSVFTYTYSVCEDKQGRIWLASAVMLGFIDNLESKEVKKPDLVSFFDNLTVMTYNSKKVEDSYFYADSIMLYLTRIINQNAFQDNKKYTKPTIIEATACSDDGFVYMGITQLGIIKFNPNLTNVEQSDNKELLQLLTNTVNSNSKKIHFKVNSTIDKVQIGLYNLSGENLLHQEMNVNSNVENELDLENVRCANGTYLLTFTINNQIIVKKILIEN